MSSEARYALLYNGYEYSSFLRLSFENFSILVVSLPFFAFFFCVIYSIVYYFESATSTHCHVLNLLPSISAAIGNYSPQKQVWQWAITLQALPRFLVAIMYFQYHQNLLYKHDQWMSITACIFNLIENLALIVLSFWTSANHYYIHEKAFITFILTSESYMFLVCWLQNRFKKQHRKSIWWKKRLLVINVSCISIATYCFMRHNSLCEPYVYTFFALAEYIVILTNMGFHMTAYLDFKNKDLVIHKYGFTLTERYF